MKETSWPTAGLPGGIGQGPCWTMHVAEQSSALGRAFTYTPAPCPPTLETHIFSEKAGEQAATEPAGSLSGIPPGHLDPAKTVMHWSRQV